MSATIEPHHHVHRHPSEHAPLLGDTDVGEAATERFEDERDSSEEEGNDDTAVVSPIRAVVIGVMASILLLIQATNVSMMTTTQSAIAADLDAFGETTWFTASYLISTASITPIGGRLCQIFSPRNFLFATSVITSAGLLITASARTLPIFLLGRVVTGCGAGGIYSTATILVLELSTKKRRGLFLGVSAAVGTGGIAGGAVLAGAVTPIYGWRLIYYIQSPLALVAGPSIYLAMRSQQNKDPNRERLSFGRKLARLDYLGILTLTSANVVFLYCLASTTIPIPLVLLAVLLFGVFAAIEASPLIVEPLIPFSLMRSRGMLLTCIASMGLMMARWAVLFYTPVYGIAVRGWSPASAGTILIPTNAGFALGGLLVGWVHIRKAGSYYISCLVIFVMFISSFFLIAVLSTPTSPVLAYVAAVFYNGFCAGALLNYTLSHVLHLTLPASHFIVTSLVAMSRSFASSFGSAIGGGIFSRVLKSRLEDRLLTGHHDRSDDGEPVELLIRRLMGSPALVSHLHGFEKEVAVESYQSAAQTLFFAAFSLVVLMAFVQAGTGWAAPPPDENASVSKGVSTTARHRTEHQDHPEEGEEPV